MILALGGSGELVAFADPVRTTTQLANLVYFPPARKFLLAGQFANSIDSSGDTSNDNGSVSAAQTEFYALGLALTYGIVDRLRVGLAEQDVLHRQNHSTIAKTGIITTTDSSGFSDPAVTVAYRAIDAVDGPVSRPSVDVVLSVNPSFGPQVAALSDQNGNNRTGAWTSTLAVPLFWRLDSQEFGLTPQLTRSFGTHIEGTTAPSTKSRTPFWSENLILQDRIHFLDVYFLQPGVNLSFANTSYYNNATARASETKSQPSFYPRWQLAFGYVFSAQSVIGLSLENYAFTTKNTAASGIAIRIRSTETTVNLQARGEF